MTAPPFVLLGDALWLDFVNTARGRGTAPPDLLADGPAWAAWCAALRLEPGDAPFPAVVEFRQHLLEIASAAAAGEPLPSSALRALNERLAGATGYQRLVRTGGSWELGFAPGSRPVALDRVARSAAETLATPGAAVRVCDGPQCTLFVLDLPERPTHWCSPDHCGRGRRAERRRRATPQPARP